MHANCAEPLVIDRRNIGAGERIDRVAGKSAKADTPGNSVDHRIHREQAMSDAAADSRAQNAVLRQLTRAARTRITREIETIGSNQSEKAAGWLADQSV